jgi:putative phosphoribosyl transferase
VILVDDGLATGATMRAALLAVRAQRPARLVCAVPVASPHSLPEIADLADDLVYLSAPEDFRAVGQFYLEFPDVEDAQVIRLLQRQPKPAAVGTEAVRIDVDGVVLDGDLEMPEQAAGLVVFAHGSGSSRMSARNRRVARALHARGLATLLFDLLSEDEASDVAARFDIPRLATRLDGALQWAAGHAGTASLPVGLFGASTGAAAALAVAARRPEMVKAVVSRGGRPDLAGDGVLARVQAPTQLIVGGADTEVIALNRVALAALTCPAKMVLVPHATHLFEEPGALETVAELAGDWFARWLRRDEAQHEGAASR